MFRVAKDAQVPLRNEGSKIRTSMQCHIQRKFLLLEASLGWTVCPQVSMYKRVMDPCTLLLEWIPKEATTDELIKKFPEAEKVNRLNERRCYMQFKTPKEAMKSRIRLSNEKVGGHQVKATFNKTEKTDAV